MKSGKTILTVVCFITAILIISPLTCAVAPAVPKYTQKITEKIRITIGTETTEKEVPLDTIYDIIDKGKACKKDFLTIYDKTKSKDDVTQAYTNIQPFFQALIDSQLTDKTVEQLNSLYYSIREKIKEPRQQPIWKPGYDREGPQPAGIWNGLPTPVWANIVCGIFDAGICAGFAAGTHTIIPTIGADIFITYGFQGTSISVGGFGATLAVSAFQVILGFVGVLLTLPLMMLGPYFMTGLCGMLIGVGV